MLSEQPDHYDYPIWGGHTINVLTLSMRIPMRLSLTVSNFIILQYTPNPRVSVARKLMKSDPMSSHQNNRFFMYAFRYGGEGQKQLGRAVTRGNERIVIIGEKGRHDLIHQLQRESHLVKRRGFASCLSTR